MNTDRLYLVQVLAVHLLCEASKGAASFWQPYLRSLPPRYTTAMCLTADEAAALQAPHAVMAAAAAAAAAAEHHTGALPLLRALGLAAKWRGRGAWLWAASTLSSRTMYLPSDSAGALAPFGDLHNYRPPPPPYIPTSPQLLAAAGALAAGPDAIAGQAAARAAAGEPPPPPAAASPGVRDAEAHSAAAAVARGEECVAGDGHLDESADEYCITARAA